MVDMSDQSADKWIAKGDARLATTEEIQTARREEMLLRQLHEARQRRGDAPAQ
jgi:hypothetical protein